MIVILCESFYDAQIAFDAFMDYIEHISPWNIYKVWEQCYCVETDENLRYIFVDYRYGDKFRHMRPDFIGVKVFFDLLGEKGGY